jgi:hypothetical protein
VLIVVASMFSGQKAYAANWEYVGGYSYPDWPNGGTRYIPAPGYDPATNTIRFGDAAVPYVKGYSYRADLGNVNVVGPYYGLENQQYGGYTGNGGEYGGDYGGYAFSANNSPQTIKIYRAKYDSSFAVYSSYKTDFYKGTVMQWSYNGLMTWRSVWGYSDINIDPFSKTVSAAGTYGVTRVGGPPVYVPTGNSEYPAYKYTPGYNSISGEPELTEYFAYWGTGTSWYPTEYMADVVLPTGIFPTDGASDYMTGITLSYSLHSKFRYYKLKSATYDSTPPSISFTPTVTNWTNTPYSLIANAWDGESGVASVEVATPGSGWYSVYPGAPVTASWNGTYYIRATDNAGNTATTSYNVTNLDFVAPQISGLSANNYRKYDAPVSVNWSASDNASGVRVVRVLGAGQEWYYSNSGTAVLWDAGYYTFYVEDNAGNTATYGINVIIDNEPPAYSIEQSPTVPTNGRVRITIRSWDTGIGISRADWLNAMEDPSWFWDYPPGSPPVIVMTGYVSANGQYRMSATDHLGQTSIATVNVTNIDKIPPTIDIQSNNPGLTNKDVVLTARATDASGILSMTSPSGAVSSGVTQVSFTATSNGTYTFYATDRAGNTASKAYTVTNIDKVPATIAALRLESNALDSKYAKYGDMYFMTVKFNKAIDMSKSVTALLRNGQTYAVSKTPVDASTFVISGYFADTKEDFFINSIVSLSGVTDLAGNSVAYTNVQTTDNSSITFYGKTPISLITGFNTTLANPGYAIEGSTITMNWTSSQHLGLLPSVKLLGRTSSTTVVKENLDGTSDWKSVVTVRKDDTQGKADFLIGSLLNKVGNREPVK